jgi:uncharacterized LabA/DUF88 family protein
MTISSYVKGNVIVFIDAANLESSLKDLKWSMDYKKLYEYFKNNTKLVGIRFYSVSFDNIAHNNFFTVLKRIGFKLVTKKLKIIYTGKNNIRKANFDVEITLDALNLIDKYDDLILFSGDSDFNCLIKFLRVKRKNIIVVSTRYHISKELIECCNKYIDLEKLITMFQRINHIK